MIVTAVMVHVKEAHVEDFITATVENHEASVKEPGNMRFDVLQCMDDPTRFMLYEAYESEEEARAHKETAHYLKWKETVGDWMAGPRRGIPHRVIAPGDKILW